MKRTITAALTAAIILAAAGCNSSSSGSAGQQARSAASSAMANPTVSTELNQSEQALLGNIQAHFSALHPVASVKAGIRATYPAGSTSQIIDFAVKNFTPAVVRPLRGPNPARDAWLLKVTDYAQSLGATPSPAVSGTGS